MFTIYDNGSVSFRSTAKELDDIQKVQALTKANMNADNEDEDNLFEDYLNGKKKDNTPNKQAINAYKKMANLDTSAPVYFAEDIMTRNCIFIENSMSLKDAYESLKENNVSQIPVIGSDNRIMGIMSKKIILNLIYDDLDNASSIIDKKIEDIYLEKIITADPKSDIRKVAKLMIDMKLDAVPIVNEFDTLVGIVSKTDILKAVSHIPDFKLWS